MKPMSDVNDQKYVKAMAHPLRLSILGALEHRTASPSELADELGAPLGNVSYHVRQLHGLGLLKLVKETPRRGAVEHYYRLERRPHITDKAWREVPSIVKEALISGVLSRVAEQVNDAAGAGGFERTDSRLSRLPLTLDDEGFEEASAAFHEFADRLAQIEKDSRKRIDRNDHAGQVPALAVLMLFEAAEEAAAATGTDGAHKRSTRRKKEVESV